MLATPLSREKLRRQEERASKQRVPGSGGAIWWRRCRGNGPERPQLGDISFLRGELRRQSHDGGVRGAAAAAAAVRQITHAQLSSSPTENRMKRNAVPKHNSSLEESDGLNNEFLCFYRFWQSPLCCLNALFCIWIPNIFDGGKGGGGNQFNSIIPLSLA